MKSQESYRRVKDSDFGELKLALEHSG